ncbi:response regulator transcription factor [Methyloversatilis thermotolerans]|uniref:response regulator transcription factor n=1 Tax=Methyloversatilis thermotolerans TaxID=1346290 RepID=UPI000374DC24|nr:response regulator [Methyloversatilis thermotolerans]
MACSMLIADGEPTIRQALDHLMTREGYSVSVAEDASHLDATLERVHPDVLLLDAALPGRSGYEICQEIRRRADARPVRIVLLSCSTRHDDAMRGRALGADAVLAKPFTARELLRTVQSLTAGQ